MFAGSLGCRRPCLSNTYGIGIGIGFGYIILEYIYPNDTNRGSRMSDSESVSTGAATGAGIGALAGPVGSLIGAGLGGIFGLIGSSSTNEMNEKIANMNINFQRETNLKNEALMREQWGREDNAVQRRAQDLAAAGMSPLLAAGSAANAGQVVNMKAPESHQVVQQSGLAGAVSGIYQGMMAQQSMMDMMARQQQILINQGSLNLQEKEWAAKEQLYSKDAGIKELTMKLMNRDVSLKDVDLKYSEKLKLLQYLQGLLQYDTENYNYGMSKKYGLRTNEQGNTITKTAQQLDHAISSLWEQLTGGTK